MTDTLTPKQQRFVEEYLIDLNATQAAIRAGYSDKTACEQGSRLLTNVKVSKAIAEAQKKLSELAEITQDMVLKRWWAIATAEVNDVIQYRRVCCRHCHGTNHAYQWKDAEEYQRAFAAADTDEKATDELLPTDDGGYGFKPTLDPHPNCPQCYGEGHGEVHAADSRKLSESARMLYDGVKITDRGFEVKTLDRAKALENVARHLGMFVDKTEITGKDGGPVELSDAKAALLRGVVPNLTGK
jgi:phage terminase small subunit